MTGLRTAGDCHRACAGALKRNGSIYGARVYAVERGTGRPRFVCAAATRGPADATGGETRCGLGLGELAAGALD